MTVACASFWGFCITFANMTLHCPKADSSCLHCYIVCTALLRVLLSYKILYYFPQFTYLINIIWSEELLHFLFFRWDILCCSWCRSISSLMVSSWILSSFTSSLIVFPKDTISSTAGSSYSKPLKVISKNVIRPQFYLSIIKPGDIILDFIEDLEAVQDVEMISPKLGGLGLFLQLPWSFTEIMIWCKAF